MNQCSFAICTSDVLPDKFAFSSERENEIHYLQTAEWYNTHSQDHLVAATFRNGELVARSIVRTKELPVKLGKIYKVERGPAAASLKDLHTHIHQLCLHLQEDGVVIEVNPYLESESEQRSIDEYLTAHNWRRVGKIRNFYKNSLVVNLVPPLEDIRRSLRKSLKNRLNKAVKLGMECEVNPDADKINQLIEQYNRMARERSLQQLDECDADYIFAGVSTGKVIVSTISVDGKQLGGNIMLSYPNKLAAEWGVYSEEDDHRKLPLSHFADWEAIKWAKENGYTEYDLCGYWLDQGKDNPINLYKSGFSKNIISVTPEYDYNLKPFLARSLSSAKKLYSKVR